MHGLENENLTLSDSDDVKTPISDSEPAAYALLNALFDSVFVLDDGGLVLALNQAAALWLGTTFSEAVGVPVENVISSELAKLIASWTQEAIS